MFLEKVYNGKTIEDVIGLLDEYKDKCKIIAGGTDIIIELKHNKIKADVLIDISKIEELKTITETEDEIIIGSAVSFSKIVDSSLFKDKVEGLHKACSMVGSPQIRNKGTIGGNIANAAAAADSVPPLIALDAVVEILSKEGKREVNLEDYYYNPVKSNELITYIRFKKLKNNEQIKFVKLGLRKALAISRLSISLCIRTDNEDNITFIRVASGALGKYPMREKEVEEYLINKKLDEETIENAMIVLQQSMDNRLKGRSTLPYKRVAATGVLKEALESTMENGKEVVLC